MERVINVDGSGVAALPEGVQASCICNDCTAEEEDEYCDGGCDDDECQDCLRGIIEYRLEKSREFIKEIEESLAGAKEELKDIEGKLSNKSFKFTEDDHYWTGDIRGWIYSDVYYAVGMKGDPDLYFDEFDCW